MNLRWIVPAAAVLGLAGGCAFDDDTAGADADNVGYMPDDLPAGQCRDTEEVANTDGDTDGDCPDTDPLPTSTTIGDTDTDTDAASSDSDEALTDACTVSSDCMGGVCAAVFDPEAEVRARFECVFACLENLDESNWCSDTDACCDPDATCTERGYCLVLPE